MLRGMVPVLITPSIHFVAMHDPARGIQIHLYTAGPLRVTDAEDDASSRMRLAERTIQPEPQTSLRNERRRR